MTMRSGALLGAMIALGLSIIPVSAAELAGTVWKPVSLATGKTTQGQEIHFERRNVNGSDGCNRFNGQYTSSGQNGLRIQLKGMATTMMACPPDVMRSGTSFMKALESTRSWRISRGRLHLVDRRGKSVAVFRR